MPLTRHLPQNSEFQDSPVLKLSQSGSSPLIVDCIQLAGFLGALVCYTISCVYSQSLGLSLKTYAYLHIHSSLGFLKLHSYRIVNCFLILTCLCVCVFRYIFKEIFKEFYNMIYFSTSFLLEILICHY